MYQCPVCKQEIKAIHGWQSVTRFNSAIAPPWLESTPQQTTLTGDYYRQQPARQATVTSDVVVPLCQSVITGLSIALVGGIVVNSLQGGVIFGVIGFSGSWLILLGAHRRLLWAIERITNTDIDHDGVMGQPQPQPQPIQLEVNHYQDKVHYQQQIIDLPTGITESMFLEFAKGAVSGKGLAITTWTGEGKLLSKAEHAEICGRLAMSGLVTWVNEKHPNLGRKLTKKGQATLQAYVDYMA